MAWQRGRIATCAGVLAALVLALTTLTPALSGAAPWAPPDVVYVPQTGHHLKGDFLAYWREHGKVAAFGNPLSEQLTENGRTVQYFEHTRLELDQRTVTIGTVGTETLAARGVDLNERPRRPRLLRNREDDEPSMTPFTRRSAAAAPADTDDHRFFPESGHLLAYSFKLRWENTGGLARYGLPISEELAEVSPIDGKIYTTQWFERARFEYHPETPNSYSVVLTPLGQALAEARRIDTAAVPKSSGVPHYDETLFSPPPTPTAAVVANRPAGVPAGRKWIDVNLSRQYLTAYEGDTIVWSGYISSGRGKNATPVGTFSVFAKLRSEDMRGPDPNEPTGEYFQPDVPYVMYFAGGGYAIHGVYWHNNFGTPMSHGCVGAPVGAASFLYGWAPVGTTIVIHY